jgi:hypothetical protein
MNRTEKGFTVFEIVLVLVIVGLLGTFGWYLFVRNKENQQTATIQPPTGQQSPETETNKYVRWEWRGEEWAPSSDAPTCSEPYIINSPMDAAKATSVLYPGQVRGGDFKPHGGIGVENSTTGNEVDVVATTSFYLYRGSRYIENGDLQHMVDFVDPCGFLHRYDHLATVSEALQTYIDQLPAAKQDDSRTTNFQTNPLFKKGDVLATKIGYESNAFFDYGLYDLRKPNEASKTNLYKTDQQRIGDKQLSFYALCWFDNLKESDKNIISKLPARGIEGKTSDYCN